MRATAEIQAVPEQGGDVRGWVEVLDAGHGVGGGGGALPVGWAWAG